MEFADSNANVESNKRNRDSAVGAWNKSKSKLQLVADMVRQVMKELRKQNNVILMFDSWYAKKELLCVVEKKVFACFVLVR